MLFSVLVSMHSRNPHFWQVFSSLFFFWYIQTVHVITQMLRLMHRHQLSWLLVHLSAVDGWDIKKKMRRLRYDMKLHLIPRLQFWSFQEYPIIAISPRSTPTWSGLIIFTNHSTRVGYDTRSIFKRSLTGLNSQFSFSLTSCLTKAEETSLSYY